MYKTVIVNCEEKFLMNVSPVDYVVLRLRDSVLVGYDATATG